MAIQKLFKKGAEGYANYLAESSADFPEIGATQAMGRGFSSSILEPEDPFQTPTFDEPDTRPEKETTWQDNVFFDALGAPVRGAINTIDSIIDLVDTVTPGDWWQYDDTLNKYLPSYLGESSKTGVGGFVEGAAQFITGFLGYGLGAAGWVTRTKALTRLKGPTSKAAKLTKYVAQPVVAGAITDFTAFDGQAERLADLIESNEKLSNSFTRFLQYEGNEDDDEFTARFKNVLEGLALEGVVGSLLFGIGRSIKGLRKYKKAQEEGADKQTAGQQGVEQINDANHDDAIEEIDNQFKEKPDEETTPTTVDQKEELTEGDTPKVKEEEVDEPFEPTEIELSQAEANAKFEKELDDLIGTGEFNLRKTDDGEYEYLPTSEMRGGEQAVESSWEVVEKLITSEKFLNKMGSSVDILAGMVAAKKLASKIKNFPQSFSADTIRGMQHVAEASGNAKLEISRLKELEDIEPHKEWLANNVSAYLILRKSSERLVEVAQKWRTNINDPEALREMAEALDFLDEASRVNSIRAGRDGIGLKARHFYKQGSAGGFQNKRIKRPEVPKEGAPVEDYVTFIQERLGKGDMQKLADRLASLNAFEGVQKLYKAQKIAKKSSGRKLLDITTEYWINSILSGPATQTVNVIGNLFTNGLLIGEKTIGALLSGDTELAKATIKYAFSAESWVESLNASRLAFWDDEARLIKGSGAFDESSSKQRAITAEGMPLFDIRDDSIVGKAINYLGVVARIPGRALLGGDEFFKNLAYRQHVKTELALQGMQKGKSGAELSKYVEEEFATLWYKESGSAYTQQGRILEIKNQLEKEGFKYGKGWEEEFRKRYEAVPFDEEKKVLADAAIKYAKKSTFTSDPQDLAPMFQGLSKVGTVALKQHPVLRFVVPFLRTPLNILNFGLERTAAAPVFLASSRYREQMLDTFKNGTRQEKAELIGRLTTATASTSFMVTYLMANAEFLTGGGPRNRKERDILRSSGWQPYSIKVGDKYVSYQRLDPIATILTMGADIRDYIKYENPDPEGEVSLALYAAAARSFAINMTDKTFLKGVNNLFNVLRDPEYYGEKLFKDIGGGFVPNILNQFNNAGAETVIRESRTLSDNLYRRVPDLAENVAPKRTILGEELTREHFLGDYGAGVINPFYVSTQKKDKLSNEMADLRYGFSMPDKNLFGIPDINLTEIKSAKGKYDAYDRLLELSSTTKINGKTMRQALSEVVKNKEYQNIAKDKLYETTGKNSPRIQILQKIINAYRTKARGQLLKENPDIQDLFEEAMKARADYFKN
jgi:hypothetical protein